MSERTFIDTNIFIYAEDADEPDKRKIAQQLIKELAQAGRAVISTQVLMEYIAAGQRSLGLTFAECRQGVLLMSHLDVSLIRSEHVLGAVDLASMYSLSPWDALILKTASASGCSRLLTEDMQNGQVIDGVRIDDPFS
jgi:predicted nucleic acid-binding protein